MQKGLNLTHKLLTGFISLGVFAQMFLAGLWHAEVTATPELHVFFGLGMLLASLIALIAALAGRMGRGVVVPTLVLFVLILLQPILMEQRENGIAFLSAFHTVNAGFIGMVSGMVAAHSGAAQPETAEKSVFAPAVTGD
jgi:hypothetical protein